MLANPDRPKLLQLFLCSTGSTVYITCMWHIHDIQSYTIIHTHVCFVHFMHVKNEEYTQHVRNMHVYNMYIA